MTVTDQPHNLTARRAKQTANTSYRHIAENIRRRIRSGELRPGAMLPSRRAIASECGVAVATAERAIASLIADGALRTDSTRGTFVAEIVDVSQAHRSSELPREVRSQMLSNADVMMFARFSPALDDSSAPSDTWIATILRSAERTLFNLGVSSHCRNLFYSDKPLVGSIRQTIQSAVADGVSACIIVDIHGPDRSDEIASSVDLQKCPVVYISPFEISRPIPHVYFDQKHMGYQAAHHLIQNGSKQLLFLAPFLADWVTARIQGASEAIKDGGLDESNLLVFPENPKRHVESGPFAVDAESIFSSFETGERPAIITSNDRVARALVISATKSGLKLGVDYALVSFDDDPIALEMGITSLRPPLDAMGETAARLIVDAIVGEQLTTKLCLRSHLVNRRSSMKVVDRPSLVG